MLKLLSLLIISLNLFAEILPADKAFIPSATVENGNLIIDFEIKDKYYLYKNKISIKALDGTKFGVSSFSKSETKNDDFFGEVQVYHHSAKITTPIKNADKTLNFEVHFQGCWEGGVCYPPTIKKFSIKNNNPTNVKKSNTLNKSNFFKALTQQSGLNDPVNVDIAFKFDAFKINDNSVMVTWKIRDNYYMYHDKFSFEIVGADFGTIDFPKGIAKTDDFFGDITIHKNQLSIDLPLNNIQDSIDLTVNYQGCWEGGVCYSPIQKKITIQMRGAVNNVIKPLITVKNTNLLARTDLSEEQQIAKDFDDSSFIWILIAFFGFGILAAFTSCIIPMIPILSSLIICAGNPSKKKAFFMSLTFVFFMALTYSVVGILTGLFGSNLQVIFQDSWVIGSFSLVFVALAFSMFGYYDIKIPNWLQEKLTIISNKQKGGHLIGVAIMGVLSALIVGPCAAPVISGALLYIGDSGDAVLGGSALFMMGLGMGLPLIAAGVGVATPKAGAWMDSVKAVFGVVMLGMAIYFLERVVDSNITIIMWATLLTISPLMLGVVSSFTENKPIHRMFKAIGLIILAFGVMIWFAIAKGYEDIDIFYPLKTNMTLAQGQANQVKRIEFKRVVTLQELQYEINNATKPIMLDFYADWCVYCLIYEKEVFTNNQVANLMQDFKLLQVDITKNNDNDKEILKYFKITAPPAILFFRNAKELRSRRVIGEKDAMQFLNILQKI